MHLLTKNCGYTKRWLSCFVLFLGFYALTLLAAEFNWEEEPVPNNVTWSEGIVIPATLSPRKELIPILNKHGFSNVCDKDDCGDFHLAVFYHTDNSCRVMVRRLDDIWWRFNVSIYIQTNKGSISSKGFTREIFLVGPSASSSKDFIVNTSIALFPDYSIRQAQLIPKTVLQTYSSRNANSIYQWSAYRTFIDLNPEYKFMMFSDRDCRKFIKKYFSQRLVDAYDLLISPTFKSDLFRYAYLAIRGGCYFDHKMISRLPLRWVIQPNDTFLVCSDAAFSGFAVTSLAETTRLYNAMICVQKQDNRIWKTLEYVIDNIERRHSTGSDLSLTGPLAFFQAVKDNITEDNIRFKHGFRSKSVMKMNRKYEDYFVKEKLHDNIFLTKFYKGFHTDPKNRYGSLWKAQMIYYDLLAHFHPWKVMVYPGQTRCVQAKFSVDGTMILTSIASMNAYELFHHPQGLSVCKYIKLMMINDETSEQYRIEIPSDDLSSLSRLSLPVPIRHG